MLRKANDRAEELKADGVSAAGVYNPEGVGGTNVLYVLADADNPESYGLPRDPKIPTAVWLWKGPVKWIGNTLLLGGIVGVLVHFLRFGPREPQQQDHNVETVDDGK